MHTPTRSMLSRSLILIGLLALGACKTTVIGGRGGEGGDGGSGGGGGVGGTSGVGGEGGVGGGVVAGPATAIAEYAYMMSQTPPPGGSSSTSGGGGVDPNTLFVRIGNYGPACGNSFPYGCTNPPTWSVSIGIPPGMQTPGVYPLSNPALDGFASVSGSDSGVDGDCWGGGGSFTDGTIEIISNDGNTIVVRLAGTSGAGFTEFSADGEYTAPICQYGLD